MSWSNKEVFSIWVLSGMFSAIATSYLCYLNSPETIMDALASIPILGFLSGTIFALLSISVGISVYVYVEGFLQERFERRLEKVMKMSKNEVEDGTPIMCHSCGVMTEVEDGKCKNCGASHSDFNTPEDSKENLEKARKLVDDTND